MRCVSSRTQQLQSVEEMLLEVRDQLSRSGVVNSDLAIPLFDSLLRVAMADVSSTAELPEEKSDRVSEIDTDETPMNTQNELITTRRLWHRLYVSFVLTVCLLTGFHPKPRDMHAGMRSNFECFNV